MSQHLKVNALHVRGGALDRASPNFAPNFMGLASLGLEIGISCDLLYSVLLLNTILWLGFLGRALYYCRPQVLGQLASQTPAVRTAAVVAVGLGRTGASETEAATLLANLVRSG
jgi:hypothetical protein